MNVVGHQQFAPAYELRPSGVAQKIDAGFGDTRHLPEAFTGGVRPENPVVARINDNQGTVIEQFCILRHVEPKARRFRMQFSPDLYLAVLSIDEQDATVSGIRDQDAPVVEQLGTMRIRQCERTIDTRRPLYGPRPVGLNHHVVGGIHNQHVAVRQLPSIVRIAERLPTSSELHGVEFERTFEPVTLRVGSYRFSNVSWQERPYEGRHPVSFDIEPVEMEREFAAGSAIVR